MLYFHERNNLPKLIHEEIDHLNRSISVREIESIINNLPKQKVPGLDRFTGKLYQAFKEEIIPIPCIFFKKVEAERLLPNSCYEASITVI